MKKLTARAQLAFCCTAMLLAAQAHAQLEGSLFTSPEERTYLDYLRAEFLRNNAEDDFNIEQTDIPEIPDATTAEPVGPVEYSFGGAMSGRDGVRVWLNGQLLGEGQLPEGFSVVQSGRSFSLRIVNDGKTYMLLPGQTVDVTAGLVVENFQRPQTTTTAVEQPVAATSSAPDTVEPADTDTTLDTESDADVQADADETPDGPVEADGETDNVELVAQAVEGMSADELASLVETLQSKLDEAEEGAVEDAEE